MAYPMLNFIFEAEPVKKTSRMASHGSFLGPARPARCPRCRRAAAAVFAQVSGRGEAAVHLRKDLCTKVSQEQSITTYSTL